MGSPRSAFDDEVDVVIRDAQRRASLTDQQLVKEGVRRPFRSPEDWRDMSIYFLMVDRFNNPNAAPASQLLMPSISWDMPFGDRQGGKLVGVTEQLTYLHALGINALWRSPLVRNVAAGDLMTYHGYAAQDLLSIDARWASDGTRDTAERELTDLVKKAHDLGIFVILDIVLNHLGRVFWYDRSGQLQVTFDDQGLLNQSKGGGNLPGILWTDGFGAPHGEWRDGLQAFQATSPDEAAYPTEFREPRLFRRRGEKTTDDLGKYPWLGFVPGDFGDMRQMVLEYSASDSDTLRKYGRSPTLSLLLRSYQYLVARYDFDGFRIDTVKYVHPEFIQRFGNAMTEFGYSIGKKNFFTYGEVADNNANIASFVGRNGPFADVEGGLGIDAALDFPLADAIGGVCRGVFDSRSGVSALRSIFDERRCEEDELISSHGDAANYFVTFVDNHDRYTRVRHPAAPDAEVRLCLGLLYTLPGIPCLYYGTEQDLVGTHAADGKPKLDSFESVREALWGKMPVGSPWPTSGGTFQMIKALIGLRNSKAALRYGRYYMRQVSGDGVNFGYSMDKGGVFACPRIHTDQEALIIACPNPFHDWTGWVEIDVDLTPEGGPWKVAFSTLGNGGNMTAKTFSQQPWRKAVPVSLRSNELLVLV